MKYKVAQKGVLHIVNRLITQNLTHYIANQFVLFSQLCFIAHLSRYASANLRRSTCLPFYKMRIFLFKLFVKGKKRYLPRTILYNLFMMQIILD